MTNMFPFGVVKGSLIVASITRKRKIECFKFVPDDELKLSAYEALVTPSAEGVLNVFGGHSLFLTTCLCCCLISM